MRSYEEFELSLTCTGSGLHVEQAGTRHRYDAPLDVKAILARAAELGGAFGRRERATPKELTAAEEIGGVLFDALFQGEILRSWGSATGRASKGGAGVRLVLRFDPGDDLLALPWELLYDRRDGVHLALSSTTPIVRRLAGVEALGPLAVAPPLSLLGFLADVRRPHPLDLDGEWAEIERAVASLEAELERIDEASSSRLLDRLARGKPIHVLHFSGHGEALPEYGDGAVDSVGDRRTPQSLYGRQLRALLGDTPGLRLVVFNTCHGATSPSTPHGAAIGRNLATRVAAAGVPAVIAHRAAVADSAARLLSRHLYESLARCEPLEIALTQVRKGMVAAGLGLAWASPVLYLAAADGQLIEAPAIRFTVHRARFRSGPTLFFFLNVTNLGRNPVVLTHAWCETSVGEVAVRPASRPLPRRLEAGEAWESWLPVESLPEDVRERAHDHFRLRLSSGRTFASRAEVAPPREGAVPGGPIHEIDKVVLPEESWHAPLQPLLSVGSVAQRRRRRLRWMSLLAALAVVIGVVALLAWRTRLPPQSEPTNPTSEGAWAQPTNPSCPSPPGLDLRFSLVPGGRFLMGAPDGVGASVDERPAHWVELSRPLCIGRFEVTLSQWNAVLSGGSVPEHGASRLPVTSVSHDRIQTFLRELNKRDPSANFRMPTEAEFEYGARAGGSASFSFGDFHTDIAHNANCKGPADPFVELAPTGSFRANRFGLYDLHGNAQEWVADWYAPYDPSGRDEVDPQGPANGLYRVRRGGSFDIIAANCNAWKRSSSKPDRRSRDLGFRIVRDPIVPEVEQPSPRDPQR